jgi:hypothetical protein
MKKIILALAFLFHFSFLWAQSAPNKTPSDTESKPATSTEQEKKSNFLSDSVADATYSALLFQRKITLSEPNDISLVLKNLRRDEFTFNWDFAGSAQKGLGKADALPVKKIGLNIAKQDKDTSVSLLAHTQFLAQLFPKSELAQRLASSYIQLSYLNVQTPLYYQNKGVETKLQDINGSELKFALLWPVGGTETSKQNTFFSGVEYAQSSLPLFFTVTKSSGSNSAYYLDKPNANTLSWITKGEFLPNEGFGLAMPLGFGVGLRHVQGNATDLVNNQVSSMNKTGLLIQLQAGLGVGGRYKWGRWSLTAFYNLENFGQEISNSSDSGASNTETVQGKSVDSGVRFLMNAVF